MKLNRHTAHREKTYILLGHNFFRLLQYSFAFSLNVAPLGISIFSNMEISSGFFSFGFSFFSELLISLLMSLLFKFSVYFVFFVLFNCI